MGLAIRFDYQSDRHCSKTSVLVTAATTGLITSQIDTAPKLVLLAAGEPVGLITSQIDTAPKPASREAGPSSV